MPSTYQAQEERPVVPDILDRLRTLAVIMITFLIERPASGFTLRAPSPNMPTHDYNAKECAGEA